FWPDEAPVVELRKLDDENFGLDRWGGLGGEDESQPWSDGRGQVPAQGFSKGPANANGNGNGFGTTHNVSSVGHGYGNGNGNGNGSFRLATVSLESHLHELGLYSYLVGTLRAIDDNPQPDGKKKRSLSGIQAASYERYLQDAGDLLAVESTYLYGLEAGRSAPEHSLPQSPFQHRLVPRSDPLLRTLVHALARFFAHSPESNLLLTGTLAALARCPYRSLEGWMCPRLDRREVGGDQDKDKEGDEVLEEQVRSVGSFMSWSPSWITTSVGGRHQHRSGLASEDGDCPIILYILLGLAAQVRRYARSIPDFGTYLRERREGLMFVENLNDALGLGGIGVEDEDGTLGFGDGELDGSSGRSTPTASSAFRTVGGGKSAGSAVVPPSQVASSLLSTVEQRQQDRGGEEGDQAGLPAVLYYKTTPPEDAGRPGTTSLPSSLPTTASRTKKKAAANARGLKRGNGGEDAPREGGGGSGVMVQPFARHYAETGSIFVGTVAVRLPTEWRTKAEVAADAAAAGDEEENGGGGGGGGGGTGGGRRIRFEDDDEEEEEDDDEEDSEDSEDSEEDDSVDTTVPSIPSVRPTWTPNSSSNSTTTTKGVLKKKRSETEFVTLSALLDNVVILEQAVMELLAVVQVRRCMGIDAVAVAGGV
ncbi:unnamed protein product, partial [Tilletia laevis]